MGNACRGSFGGKTFQGYAEPQHSNPNHNYNPDSNPPNLSKEQPRSTMNRTSANQSYYVLGHKTPNIRDLYTLGRKLGQGQFGTTYLCTELSSGVDYACKSIAKRKLISKEDVEDVRREIQIMHHLAGHKNIVSIKGAYEDPLYVHIVMELCGGGELFDRIIQRGHYTERKAADLTKIIVGVVEACHSLGVMHRDLKPENFLLVNKDDDFSLKAIDFGLSVFFKPGQIFTDVVGSPYYVAPEVLLKHYGPEADVWTAGVILYILLSGVPPFWAETQQGIFDAVLKGHIDFDSDPWPLISESAKDLIRKMLCMRPAERLTAHEVLCHPWICENGVAPDRALDPAVLSRLKHFSAMNKLKKMALRVIAESLSEEEIAGLKEMFKAMDTDNSGAITFDELKHRIGQKKVVNVYRLITRGTLEEKILSLQRFKIDVASTVVNQQNAGLSTMDTDQILDLFNLGDSGPNLLAEKEKNGMEGREEDMVDLETGDVLRQPGKKAWLDDLGELWDNKQYEESFDLNDFMKTMS